MAPRSVRNTDTPAGWLAAADTAGGHSASRGTAAASLEATREGWRTLRRDTGRGPAALPPDVVEEAMAAYEQRGVRLVELQRQIDAVRQAIDGLSWIPGAGRWARV